MTTFLDGLYGELLERGVRYFFPNAHWLPALPANETRRTLECGHDDDGTISIDWLGVRRRIAPGEEASFSDAQVRLVRSIGHVLESRYRLLFSAPHEEQNFHFFRNTPEDRYVSAYLDPGPYLDCRPADDRISEALEVLRISASTTYENRRIATGVLLFGTQKDPCHALPSLPEGALPYSYELTSIRSFHRLCDGLQSMALVDLEGRLVEIVDVQSWARPFQEFELPAPEAARFAAHARATLCGGHVCLTLTPNGEIKAFAEGAEVFRFVDGRWRLTDAAAKYRVFQEAMGSEELSERLFRCALNLSEDRRGALFVVLDDREALGKAVLPLNPIKAQLHYLLRGASALELPGAVLESVARIDGAVVMDRFGNILAFGAILQTSTHSGQLAMEGGRTTAGLAASRYGLALKVSEDGLVALYRNGECVWEM